MVSPAVMIGTSLVPSPTGLHPQSLLLASIDLTNQPGAQGNGYHVPIGSIEVDEQGPGGVSKLSFDLVDPLGQGPLPEDGDEVIHWDNVNNRPWFGGFVSNWNTTVLPNSQGRVTSIECVGFETILDWALIPFDLVVPAGMKLQAAIQLCASVAEGTRGLRAFGSGARSNQAAPISPFDAKGPPTSLSYATTIAAGTSLREALNRVAQASATTFGITITPANALFTVDFYRGLRGMEDSATNPWATDYVDLTVSDTLAGVNVASDLEHETDATQIVRGVFIQGANAAGTGFLGDGSGRPGRIAFMQDTTIDTAAKLLDAQATYLNQYVIANRGSFDLVDWTPTGEIRPGSKLTLTDAQANATGTYRIYQITKRFLKSGRETWTITYGGLRPSATRLLRRLTRDTRS